jgi:hypothetical protein
MPQQADVSRLFLQAMLSRGAVTETLARTIWKKCIDTVNGQIYPRNPFFHFLM